MDLKKKLRIFQEYVFRDQKDNKPGFFKEKRTLDVNFLGKNFQVFLGIFSQGPKGK